MVTTIQIDESTKEKLNKLKVHHRESYNELILRLVNNFSSKDAESLMETIEIMSNPDLMRSLANGMEEIKKGNYGTSLKDLEEELS